MDETKKAKKILGGLGFVESQLLGSMQDLSGGWRMRISIAKVVFCEPEILMLDEPTNHLDLDSCDSLLSAIKDFDGAVLMVTHDEYFLREIANKLIIFDNDKVSVFEGSYDDFLEKVGWTDEY